MPLLVFLVAWAAQGGVIRNGWVWDDDVVRQDPAIQAGVSSIPRLLTRNWFGDADDVGLYRPLVSITLAIEASIHGTENAAPFHSTNLFLHGLVAWLLLATLLRLAPGRPFVAAGAALVFAAHPLHTGTVSWIVARGDLLAALFGLLAVLSWFRRTRAGAGPDLPSVLLTCTFTLLALLAKEVAVVLPLVLFLLDLGVRREAVREATRRRWASYAALALPVATWLTLRHLALRRFDAPAATALLRGRDLVERVMIGAGAGARAAWKTFLPVGLTGDGSHDPVLAPQAPVPFAYLACAFVGAFAAVWAVWRLLRGRAGLSTAAIGLFLVLWLPTLQVMPLGAVFEDRFAYVPSLALLVLAGLALEAIVTPVRRGAAARFAASGAGAVVLVALSTASWAVAGDWRDDRAFNEAILADDPGHVKALDRLALWHLRRAQDEREAAAATRANDRRRQAHLANERHDLARAVELLERATTLPDGRTKAGLWRSLGDAYEQALLHEKAEDAYRKVLAYKMVRVAGVERPSTRIRVGDVASVAASDRRFMGQTWYQRGRALLGIADKPSQAVDAFVAATQWDAGNVLYRKTAGAELLTQGDYARAIPQLSAAARLSKGTEDGPALDELYRRALREARETSESLFREGAALLAETGKQTQALAKFEEAAEVRPNYARAWYEAARLQRYVGNLRLAIDYAKRARDVLREEAAADPGAPVSDDDKDLLAKAEALVTEYEAEFGK
jgi:tetratricopeptide (TPR) repeat protein